MTTDQRTERTSFRLPWGSRPASEALAEDDADASQARAELAWPAEDVPPGRGVSDDGPAPDGMSEGQSEAPVEAPGQAAVGLEADGIVETPDQEEMSLEAVALLDAEVGVEAEAQEAGPADVDPQQSGQTDDHPQAEAMDSAAPEPAAPRTARVAAPASSSAAPLSARSRTEATGLSRPAKLMADLSRAMQTAAQAARDEALAKLSLEANARIEEIEQAATTGVTDLRQAADDDIAATRDWSKAEIARIKEETDRRIAERKASLETEIEQHAASVRRRAELVREAVAVHEQELAAFIDGLLAEDDPARIAVLAQSMPEPPALDTLAALGDDPGSAGGSVEDDPRGAAAARIETHEAPLGTNHADVERLSAETAAAAEAEALADLGESSPAGWPSRGTVRNEAKNAHPVELQRTEIVVSGLSSVAGIAGFKRELSRIEGVHSVAVSAGQAGEFVFAVAHEVQTDLAGAIPTITAYGAEVRDRDDAMLLVSASEPTDN